MWGNTPTNYYAPPPGPVNPYDPRTRPEPAPGAPIPAAQVPVAPTAVCEPAPVIVPQAAPVAPVPTVVAPPVARTNPKTAGPGHAATTSTGAPPTTVATGAPQQRESYPPERTLVVKTTRPDRFLTDFMADIQNPLLEAGFARRTLKEVVQRYRLFTKRGLPKRTWGMCFRSVEDANATWAEYRGIREAVHAKPGHRHREVQPKAGGADTGVNQPRG